MHLESQTYQRLQTSKSSFFFFVYHDNLDSFADYFPFHF
ncbi:hypothetical protein D2M30_1275 [Bacillus amyloliquefaciens]|nr:hypothetical protein D2M30_1275 [Bacillus amyloliquefaciens]